MAGVLGITDLKSVAVRTNRFIETRLLGNPLLECTNAFNRASEHISSFVHGFVHEHSRFLHRNLVVDFKTAPGN